MRRDVIDIDRFTDSLPSPDKGSFCDRPQARMLVHDYNDYYNNERMKLK